MLRARSTWRPGALALTMLSLAAAPAARAQAPQDAPAMPAATTATPSSLEDLPLGTRVRLQTVGLPAFGGLATGGGVTDRSNTRTLVGALTRIDSTPQLTFVVQTTHGTWGVPRTAITGASRYAGTASAGTGVRRSALTGALLGTAAAVLYAQAIGGSDKAYGTRVPIAAGTGAAIALLFWRGQAREEWDVIALPPLSPTATPAAP